MPMFKTSSTRIASSAMAKRSPRKASAWWDYASVMKGGEHGPIVVKGKLKDSVLAQVLRGTNGKKQMPFGMAPLSDEGHF